MNHSTPFKPAIWAGRTLSGIVLAILLADALVNLASPEKLSAEMAATGYSMELSAPLGFIILVCALVYAVPATCVVGAILITAFAGGSIATHFRLAEFGSPPEIISVLIAVFAWAGLLLRYPALRAFLPLLNADGRR